MRSGITVAAESAPAIGVHRPISSKIANAATIAKRVPGRWCLFPSHHAVQVYKREIPSVSLRRRSPLPGQPFGNMEKRRCRLSPSLWSNLHGIQSNANVQTRNHEILLSSNQRSMIPRFSAMVTACVLSFAASLERMLLTWALTVSSVTANRSATILFAFPCATS